MPDQERTDEPGHTHKGMEIPDESGDRFGAPGRRIDGEVLAVLVGAAIDGCGPCQDTGLDALVADALTLVRLVEISATAVQGVTGGLPESMVHDGPWGALSGGYRALVRSGLDREGHAPMYAVAAALDAGERRQAAQDALDIVVGVLMVSR